jgi:hypothetical protein
MSKLIAGLLSMLWACSVLADEAEQPMETSTTGIVIFFIATLSASAFMSGTR